MSGTRFKVMDIAAGSPTITDKIVIAGPGRLFGLFVNTTLSAHAVTIANKKTSSSPNVKTTIATIPASATAGTGYRFEGVEFDDSLVLVTNASGTGNVTVQYQSKFRQA